MSSLFDIIGWELEWLIEPLASAAGDAGARRRLLLALGAGEALQDDPTLLTAIGAVDELRQTIAELAGNDEPSLADVARVLDASAALFSAFSAFDGVGSAQLTRLGEDLAVLVTGLYVRSAHPLLTAVGSLLTLLELADMGVMTDPVVVGGEVVRRPFPYTRIRLDRLQSLLTDPAAALTAYYAPNGLTTLADANAVAEKVFPRVGHLLTQLKVPWTAGLREDELAPMGDAAPFVDHALQIYLPPALASDFEEAGVTLTLSSDDHGGLGLVVSPFGELNIEVETATWRFKIALAADVQAFAIGRHGATFLAGPDTTSVEASFTASRGEPGTPAFIFGAPTASRLEIGGVAFGLKTALSEETQEVAISADLQSGKFVITPEGDGFLASLMPGGGIRGDLALGMTWSNVTGLSLRGGAGLVATIPVGVSVAGITLRSIEAAIRTTAGGAAAELGAQLLGTIGPFSALVDGAGLRAFVDASSTTGSFGAVDIGVGLKRPSGVGLTVNGGILKGGGFLRLDPEHGEYAGALELTCAAVSLKAIVVLHTKVEGAPFALLAMVYARFPGGLELGLRFTLYAVGGMIGINHRFDYQALADALPSGAMDNILFPENPVGDAPRILASLASICPVKPGAYTLALMAELGWGSDYICALRIGIVLPLDDMRRIYLVGQVRVQCFRHLPEILRLQIICDALGEIGFDPFSIRIDGRLRDSRFGVIGIEGQLVLLLTTGADPRFLIAAGGFHPNFKNIPAGLPSTIDRLAVTYDVGHLKAWFNGYFAVAAGTVQFGAEIGCRYKSGSLGFSGNLGIDALIHLEPFMFEADAHFNVAVEYRGHELFGVHVNATLWGPDRWRIKGHGSFSILFWDVGIDFDESWGDDVAPAAEPIILLRKAEEDLQNDTYWQFEAPEAAAAAVQFASGEANGAAVHPLAVLSYRQRRFPFSLDLDRIGSAPIEGGRSVPVPGFFDAKGDAIPGGPALDPFAIGEYVDLPDDARLTRPSFEPLPSGASAGIGGYCLPEGPAVQADLDYEQIFLPRRTRFDKGLDLEDLQVGLIRNLLSREAAGTSAARAQGKLARPREPVRSEAPKWAATDPLNLQPAAAEVPAWAERSPAAIADRSGKTGLVLVEAFELAA